MHQALRDIWDYKPLMVFFIEKTQLSTGVRCWKNTNLIIAGTKKKKTFLLLYHQRCDQQNTTQRQTMQIQFASPVTSRERSTRSNSGLITTREKINTQNSAEQHGNSIIFSGSVLCNMLKFTQRSIWIEQIRPKYIYCRKKFSNQLNIC